MMNQYQKLTAMLSIALVTFFLTPVSAESDQYRTKPGIWLSSRQVAKGTVLTVAAGTGDKTNNIESIHLVFEGKTIPFFEHPLIDKHILVCIIGIPYHAKPGTSHVKIEWTDPYGRHIRSIPVAVVTGNYKSEQIRKVNSRTVNPKPGDIQRAQKESREIKKAYLKKSPELLWDKPFQIPINDRITSPYGTRRIINGKLKRYHSGVDLRAKTGTPVRAANAGVVRFAKNTFFGGNLVIIDHGMDIFSSYAHMSKINVRVNQVIEKGRIIGLAGATGRVNGPHLHWGIRVNGANVDPIQFLRIINEPVQSKGKPFS